MTHHTTVVFILGGPGSGKGTQSTQIQDKFKFVHLSAGDLLREERKTHGSQFGDIIEKNIVEGKIVPSQITVMLLEKAMKKIGFEDGRFLIDGFPRNIENLSKWEELMSQKVTVPFIIHLKCSEETMQKRILKRAQTSGRSDDNIESIRKRFKTYEAETMKIIQYYEGKNKCVHINSEQSPEAVFAELSTIFIQHKF